ncbi:DegV family protein [Clostridium tarantellae]|uniref:DegV family EDD domain-containing protein n=1 Tax=Clostridium tarantellae TaxID=39493 RepID=A0A6I1MJR0_9CLOT|nr:DegV family protein [Clostridium tarantellae]MPQ43184.1 DegV family EDD domain-containing protein [Clostridium tarantellae]
MSKIKIITDSTCDLSRDLIDKHNIEILPVLINFGEESYLDGVEINLTEMLTRIEVENCLPTTAQVTPNRFMENYKKYLDEGYKIISIHLSSKMSGTYQSACIAKQMLESEDIIVIDSHNVTLGLGMIVLKACNLVKEGKSFEEIEKEILEYKKHVKSTIAFESLDNLVRGGRLSKGKAMFVNALGIKLLLNIQDGEMNVLGKVRGSKKIIKEMILTLKEVERKSGEPIILVEFENEEVYQGLKIQLDEFDIEHLRQTVGCAVGIHSGSKVCALFYVENY